MDILSLLVYISILALCFLLVLAFEKKEAPRMVDRLQKVQQGKSRATFRDQDVMRQSLATRLLLPLADRFSKYFGSMTPQGTLDQCRRDIASAGLTGKVTALQITTLSWMGLIIPPAFFFFLTMATPRTTQTWMIIFISAVLGYRLPVGIIQSRAAVRRAKIQKALPFTFDLIGIGVEAGISFDGALALVGEKTQGPLSEELSITLNEIRLGKSRVEALKDLGDRVGLEDLRIFLTAVSYISKMGGSLVDVIRVQTEAMRVKRRQKTEEKAMKTPVKIMIPLVLFIFPAMFVVLLGPAMIKMMKSGL